MKKVVSNTALFFGTLLSLCACAAQKASESTMDAPLSVTVAGQELKLEQDQGRCILLKPDESKIPLDMPWPCRFGVDDHGNARIEYFEKAPVVLVQHLTITPDKFPQCQSQYRAIRYFKGQLEMSVSGQGASCGRGPVDQKMFTGLFRW